MSRFTVSLRSFRPTYSGVVSTLALIVALSGTAVAASAINGALIKNHTVTATKLKAHTLTGAQIKGHSIAASELKAHSITANEVNLASLGLDRLASSGSYNAAGDGTYRAGTDQTEIHLDSPVLAPGPYLVVATVQILNTGAAGYVDCTLNGPGSGLDSGEVHLEANGESQLTLELTDTVTTPQVSTLSCFRGGNVAFHASARITTLRLGAQLPDGVLLIH